MSVVIATRNRMADLRRALQSVRTQDIPCEILVLDDASTDGTPAMVREEFPTVRVVAAEQSSGYIVQRNRGAQLAKGEFIVSIDDDAEFPFPDTIAHTLGEFGDPRVGAVAIPHIDTLSGRIANKPASTADVWCVAQYVGTAHAVRRELFVRMGGYREDIVHQGEEGDFCLRMLSAGYVTRLGSASPIHHHESPRRSFWRMEYYGRRNDVRQAWVHAPARWLLPHLVATTVNGLRQAIRTRRPAAHLQGLASGWGSVLIGNVGRQPVAARAYRLFRRLKKKGPLRLIEFEQQLAPMPMAPP